ncbi:MAG: hypothetical protein HYT22_02345 [Candidatus Niyogibacteria bacterium]|nr:hypothetical protein [Candidatus Niyogibacteria bacterium]
MVDETNPQEDQFELIFKNGALANLKKLAGKLNISEENLGEAVNKSIKILSIIKNVRTKTITLETEDKQRFVLDADEI